MHVDQRTRTARREAGPSTGEGRHGAADHRDPFADAADGRGRRRVDPWNEPAERVLAFDEAVVGPTPGATARERVRFGAARGSP